MQLSVEVRSCLSLADYHFPYLITLGPYVGPYIGELPPGKGAGKGGSQKGAADLKAAEAADSGPEWVRRNPRQSSKRGLYAVALSYDDKCLAVGGGDKKVHVFDGVTGAFLQAFPGHRDAITALAFREGEQGRQRKAKRKGDVAFP